jgi:hypothetical protein
MGVTSEKTWMIPIIPAIRCEPFDNPAWLFDVKLNGFHGPDRRRARQRSYRSLAAPISRMPQETAKREI